MSASSSCERVELAVLGGEIVVEIRQHALLDLLDLRGVGDGLAAQLLAAVVVGVGDLDADGVAGTAAAQLLVEAGQQPFRAELDHVVARARRGQALAVDLSVEVDDQEVALLGGPIHGRHAGALHAQPLELSRERHPRGSPARPCRLRGR